MSEKILIVEDDSVLRETLTYNLTRQGYDVITAADGRSAITLAEQQHPELILLDVMLPGLDGMEVCRRLHAALLQRGQVACWLALDRHSGEPHAGLCVAYDTRRAGILLTGTDPAHKSASAIWLLFWEAIVFCLEKQLSLDFEGSMDRNIERGFRAFGADLVPYHSIWRPGNRVLDIAYRLIKQ